MSVSANCQCIRSAGSIQLAWDCPLSSHDTRKQQVYPSPIPRPLRQAGISRALFLYRRVCVYALWGHRPWTTCASVICL